ncbi:hypothetical protein H4O21_11205 [Oceanospirillum sp. D5]|uniref:Neurotransmitter-gated ion-channel ligand-binding domain-containing protein n=2 Tax=Oceanospirillum sediminis TaxID=2760088 RepID=A0A839IRV7_9GAMM|nr:hypothetical protein [Oceanospirillum sediminis]
MWSQMNQYYIEPSQLTDEESANTYLQEHWESQVDATKNGPMIKIKTGLFIQSLKFFNSTEVNLSGYIWQTYKDGVHDNIKPGPSDVGFILPEQVNSGSDIQPREAYRIRNGDEEVIGWYFEATLRQPFDYSKYPFDHKTVWVRIWPESFSQNVVLVPDFNAYKSTGPSDTFGIAESIVLGTWERQNTFFDYKLSSYDTNFGIANYTGQTDFPELYYNFVVKRKFENAFIIYLLPLFLVSALLFAALLTVSSNDELSNRFGFNTSGFIGASSALFFVVMLAHIQLREQFGGEGIVYIEYFYIIMYGLLVTATANTYLFSIRSNIWGNIISYNDNIIPKVAYWPFVLSTLIAVTWYVM